MNSSGEKEKEASHHFGEGLHEIRDSSSSVDPVSTSYSGSDTGSTHTRSGSPRCPEHYTTSDEEMDRKLFQSEEMQRSIQRFRLMLQLKNLVLSERKENAAKKEEESDGWDKNRTYPKFDYVENLNRIENRPTNSIPITQPARNRSTTHFKLLSESRQIQRLTRLQIRKEKVEQERGGGKYKNTNTKRPPPPWRRQSGPDQL